MNVAITNLKGENGVTVLSSSGSASTIPGTAYDFIVPITECVFSVLTIANQDGTNPTSITYPPFYPIGGRITAATLSSGAAYAYKARH